MCREIYLDGSSHGLATLTRRTLEEAQARGYEPRDRYDRAVVRWMGLFWGELESAPCLPKLHDQADAFDRWTEYLEEYWSAQPGYAGVELDDNSLFLVTDCGLDHEDDAG